MRNQFGRRALGRATFALVASSLFAASNASAGVFSSVHFVNPGEFALGLEPEVTLASGAGVSTTARYTQGVNDLTNITGLIGTGNGPRQFRVGGNMTLDFFPDTKGQPGMGLMFQGIYYRLPAGSTSATSAFIPATVNTPSTGQLEVTVAPYIHKNFNTGGQNEIDPFLAIPFGWTFQDGQYKNIALISLGSMIKANDHLSYVAEFGVGVNNTDTYFSGGIVYYH